MTRKRLYPLVLIVTIAGIIFCAGETMVGRIGDASHRQYCLFRAVTGIPCPACGTTRSVDAILHGDLAGSVHYNPLGWIMLVAMILFPAWVIVDQIRKRDSFLRFYLRVEELLRKPSIYIPALILILANWAWGVFKFTGQ